MSEDYTSRIRLPETWAADWVLDRKLGSGAFSTVYRAVRKDRPSIEAAIKIISIPASEADAASLLAEGMTEDQSQTYYDAVAHEYIAEIDLMEDLKGTPNIVGIEDYKVVRKTDSIGNDIFIRMELLKPLDAVLRRRSLTEQEVLQLGIDICSALDLCASKRIIHRDIKPANIFINDKMPGRVFFKLGDFGVARSLETMTHHLSRKGTPNYMAPEIFNNRPADCRADLYSLGITLYRLLNNNQLPFLSMQDLTPASMERAMSRRLGGEKLPPPASGSPALCRIVLKACEYNPEDRYADAAEMKAALEALQNRNAKPVLFEQSAEERTALLAEPRNVPDQKTQKKKKSPGLIIALILCACLILVGSVILITHTGTNQSGLSGLSGNETTGDQTVQPTITSTEEPTAIPTATPTAAPTATPTAAPTATPTAAPTATPTAAPTATPTATPTAAPTATPTATPTAAPTATPTAEPTATPTATPTPSPTATPTATPTAKPTATPTPTFTPAPTAEPTATPTAEPAKQTGYATTVFDHTAVRNAPEDAAASVDELPAGKMVKVIAQSYTNGQTWHLIQYENSRGYTRADQLRMMGDEEAEAILEDMETADSTEPEAAKDQDSANQYGYVTMGSVNFREKPSTRSARILQLRKGVRCLILGQEEVDGVTWYQVEYKGKTGYISGEYFQPITSEEEESSTVSNNGTRGGLEDEPETGKTSGQPTAQAAGLTGTQTAAPAATATAVPTATQTAVPTATPTPVPTATPTATPTPKPRLKDMVEAGKIITFGRYEQDNNTGNGQEAIDWIVMEVQDGRCLLLSKYGLDVLPYNSSKKGVSWENCSLRKWLNNDFLYTAFTAEEQAAILLTDVDNSAPHRFDDWKSEGGPNTKDYIYLLSVEEGIRYFGLIRDKTVSNMKAKCAPTDYALQRGVYIPPEDTIGTEEGKKSGSWWLRSPGRKQTYAAGVGGLGNLGTDSVDTKDNAVRPCLWLNLNSDFADTLQITSQAQ